ncbi:MAG: High molecular weight rubredoxin [Bacteroidales bacterium]|nr:High molecular weight rubredoxin [Bacteroidales bacterium]
MIEFKAFHALSYGVYLVCSEYEGKKSGYVANTGFQVTSNPSVLAISCSKKNYSCDIISKRGVFSLSVLRRDLPVSLIQDFGFRSSRDFDKFSNYSHKTGQLGVPVVTDCAVAFFECNVLNSVDCGSHILFFGEVAHSEKLSAEPVLTYDYYHEHYKMLSPENAPTFIPPELLSVSRKELISPSELASEYICILCGYTYNPELGEPENGIPPGTPFDALPEDYICPICRASKEYFREI